MDPDVQTFGQVMLVIVMFLGSLSAIGITVMYAIKKMRRMRSPIAEYDTRLEQLQQSVDAIAIEVERISEAQRFTAQLLAQRSETPALER